jgi:hypothetical protein
MRSALLTFAATLLLASPAAAAPQISVPAQLQLPETAGEARIPVTLDGPSADSFRVPWSTTASVYIPEAPVGVGGRDMIDGSGTLEFEPGETRKEIVITLLDDASTTGPASGRWRSGTGR